MKFARSFCGDEIAVVMASLVAASGLMLNVELVPLARPAPAPEAVAVSSTGGVDHTLALALDAIGHNPVG